MEEKTFPFELKEIDEKGVFEGYAAIFGKPDALNEIVEKGAFTKTLKENRVLPMLWYHDPKNPIGIITQIEEDDKGLKVKGELNLDVQAAREKYALMKQKAIRGLSFGFNTIKDLWEGNVRKLKEIKLFEVSPCTFQAHPKALIANVKQWSEEKPYPNEHSARLQDPGKFDKFRRKANGKLHNKIAVPGTIDQIWGHLEGEDDDAWATQALRFPTKNWSAEEAKAWLKKNDVKYQNFEAASKSLEGVIEFLEGFKIEDTKSGKMISAANMKLINNAVEALVAILKKLEPLDDTQDDKKGILAPIIRALELEDKPQSHLSGIIEALEN